MQSATLILLYSEYSDNCHKLRRLIKDEFLNHFEKVCIDSEEIRDAIVKSEGIKINEVPCFLHVYQDGTVAKYEANDAFKLIMQYMANNSEPNKQNQSVGLPVSSVDKILSGLNNLTHAPPLSGAQSRKPIELNLHRNEPPKRGPRRPFHGITSERDIESGDEPTRPTRGEGHENMRSSLSGIGRTIGEDYEEMMQSEPETAQQELRKDSIIQDLTHTEDIETFEEDPSGMSIPRADIPILGSKNPASNKPQQQTLGQTLGQMGGRGKEKTNSVKALARKIAAAREAEEKNNSITNQEPARSQRSSSKSRVIDISNN